MGFTCILQTKTFLVGRYRDLKKKKKRNKVNFVKNMKIMLSFCDSSTHANIAAQRYCGPIA